MNIATAVDAAFSANVLETTKSPRKKVITLEISFQLNKMAKESIKGV